MAPSVRSRPHARACPPPARTSLPWSWRYPVPGPQWTQGWGRGQGLTYEGLFVGASLLHVGAWLDSAATVVHLVHDAMQADVRGQLEGVLQQVKLLDLPRLPRVDGSCYLEGPGVPLLSRTGLQEVLRGCLSFQLNEERSVFILQQGQVMVQPSRRMRPLGGVTFRPPSNL